MDIRYCLLNITSHHYVISYPAYLIMTSDFFLMQLITRYSASSAES